MFCFIVLLLLIGAAFYFYQKLMAIETEIRAERSLETAPCSVAQEPDSASGEVSKADVFETKINPLETVPVEEVLVPVETAIIAAVTDQAGIKQTELYSLFADQSKKQLQQTIKDMTARGLLRREKQGSSYLLYIA